MLFRHERRLEGLKPERKRRNAISFESLFLLFDTFDLSEKEAILQRRRENDIIIEERAAEKVTLLSSEKLKSLI